MDSVLNNAVQNKFIVTVNLAYILDLKNILINKKNTHLWRTSAMGCAVCPVMVPRPCAPRTVIEYPSAISALDRTGKVGSKSEESCVGYSSL